MKKTLWSVASIGLAGAMLWCGSAQVSAATLKDVFDEHYYADTYEDLKAVYGYDREALWNHYINLGLNEGRSMSGLIDVVKYRQQYADLDAAFGDDWDAYLNHYLSAGAKEGRNSGTDFNVLEYLAENSDLQAVYGNDVLALWKYYQTTGSEETVEVKEEPQQEKTTNAKTYPLADGGWITEEYNEVTNITRTNFYNANGNISTYWENQGRVEREFNTAGQRLKETRYTEGEGRHVTEYYADLGKMKSFSVYLADGKLNYRDEIDEYDAAGNEIKRTRYNAAGEATSYDLYEYDAAGRMIKLTEYDMAGKIKQYVLYEYDTDGNRKIMIYNAAGKLVAIR